MFDDLDEIEDEVILDPKKYQVFARELLAAAEARNVVREKQLLGSLDDGFEAAVHAAGKGTSGSKAAFADWLQLLLRTIAALALEDLSYFVWEAPGKERAGAALVRRLQAVINSGTFDSIKVEGPTNNRDQPGLVLLLGRAGTTYDDLETVSQYWRERGCTVVRANHCAIHRLRNRQSDQILAALVENGISEHGLIGHFFSENGNALWGHITERWEKCPPVGLPPLEQVLKGCAYDSCNMFACHTPWPGASGDLEVLPDHRKAASRGAARHVTMNATLAMARDVFGPEDERTMALADVSGPIFKGVVEVYAHRGGYDDPIFGDGGPDAKKTHQREPNHIPRIFLVSKADVTMRWTDAEGTAKWIEDEYGQAPWFVLYETAMNCSMHKDDPAGYFQQISDWVAGFPAYVTAHKP